MVSDVSKETKIPYLYARENRVFIDKELENYSLIKSEEEVSIEIFSELRRYLNKPIRIEYVDNEESR